MVASVAITNSVVAGGVPSAGLLVPGALAVNVTDGTLYTKNYSGDVVRIEGDGGNGTIASASTLALGAVMAAYVDVSGTTAVTAITLRSGQTRTVRFTGALTLTNGANLVLPGGADIATAAGDYATFRGYGSGVVRCVLYTKIAGFVATATAITDDTTTNSTMYPVWAGGASGSGPLKVSSSKLTFNPATGVLTVNALQTSAINGFAPPTKGAWTPTDASGAGLDFAFASGRYFNIGDLWVLTGRVTFPTTVDAAQAAFGGLPAVCGLSGHPEYNSAGVVIGGGTANKLGPDRGSTVAYLYTTGNTGATNAGQSGQTCDFGLSYLAA